MTPRKRLSLALKAASNAAKTHNSAQSEMHHAFEAVYGEELDLQMLGGDAWVDALVYGTALAPSLKDFDEAVSRGIESREPNPCT